MKHALLLGLAFVLGLLAGEVLSRDFSFRASLGRLVRRGELVALVDQRGIYRDGKRPVQSLVEDARLTIAAERERVPEAAIDQEMVLLRWQFPDERAWDAALERAGTDARALRREVARNLRGRAWLEARLGAQISPNEKEERRFYEEHCDAFLEPQRFRASHLFLAAPDGYPDEVIKSKRALGGSLSARLDQGESFAALVAEYSEDENSKRHEGDLNYFAEARILPALWNAAQQLEVGATSGLIRSRLGFHLFRLTNKFLPQPLTFEQAAPEIALTLANEKRAAAVAALIAQLPGKIQFATPDN